jgi:hypothetical protein
MTKIVNSNQSHKSLMNEAKFDVLYTIYCNLGQFTLIIRETDYKKA